MTPVELLLSKLPDAKPAGKGWSARCRGFHDDRHASLLSVAAAMTAKALASCSRRLQGRSDLHGGRFSCPRLDAGTGQYSAKPVRTPKRMANRPMASHRDCSWLPTLIGTKPARCYSK